MKLFNGIRQKMIEGKRLKNYVLYAIGEIVLVVIGILIAVSINKNTEVRKAEENTNKMALQIKQKLESDIEIINETRSIISEDLKIYDLYLKKDKTDEERLKVVTQAPFLVTISVQFAPINPIMSSALENATSNNSELSQKLLEIEQYYKSMESTLKPMEKIITDELISNLRYIKDNFSWYEKLVSFNAKFTVDEYKYFGSDDYRNRVVHMKFLYLNAYDGLLESFEEQLSTQLKELNALREQEEA
ncbi:hypothetical protein H8K90_07850 [Winogradskyella echinorum]|uniref:Type IV pili methyl-accepting chemotaxis transducer N-term n=1 Tax=Winogradskyella echinorum TaxID=538189 RepID=A0ABR6Y227_9FLAO|nr:hypothetical protein [Winogradskyella echinorum]MBC3846288.1 hypothetical protein [Winogradskyella echinorum]MBC5750636.1 hypothetical protein [Winogradskyella echinorum]